jgi:hypothetical protein
MSVFVRCLILVLQKKWEEVLFGVVDGCTFIGEFISKCFYRFICFVNGHDMWSPTNSICCNPDNHLESYQYACCTRCDLVILDGKIVKGLSKICFVNTALWAKEAELAKETEQDKADIAHILEYIDLKKRGVSGKYRTIDDE